MRRVLTLTAYRRLLAAYTLNELAQAVGSLALTVLVYRRTGSAIGAASFFLSAQFLPALVAPAVVARVDRLAPARVLPTLYALEAVAFLGLAALASSFSLTPLLALAFIDGVLALTARSLARAASVAVTSPVGLLREGNALINASFSVCFMVGPPIGAVIASGGGTVAALLAGSGLFVLIGLTLITARDMPVPVTEGTGSAGRLRAALSYAMAHPPIRRLFGLQGIALVFFTISIPVEVVFALHVLHAGQNGYGVLLASWGLGMLAGSTLYVGGRAWPARQLIAGGAALLGIGLIVMATAPSLAVALIGGALAGTGNGIEAVAARTALQENVEPAWMGIMMGLNESLFRALPGIGIALGGAISTLAGPRTALATAGSGAILVTVLAWVLLRGLDQPAAGPHAHSGPQPGRREPRSSPAPSR